MSQYLSARRTNFIEPSSDTKRLDSANNFLTRNVLQSAISTKYNLPRRSHSLVLAPKNGLNPVSQAILYRHIYGKRENEKERERERERGREREREKERKRERCILYKCLRL